MATKKKQPKSTHEIHNHVTVHMDGDTMREVVRDMEAQRRQDTRLQARATVYAALVVVPRTEAQGRDVDSIVKDTVAIVAKLEAAS